DFLKRQVEGELAHLLHEAASVVIGASIRAKVVVDCQAHWRCPCEQVCFQAVRPALWVQCFELDRPPMAGRFRSPTPDRIAWTPGQTKAVLRTKHPSLSILAFNVDNMDAIQKRDRSSPLTLG